MAGTRLGWLAALLVLAACAAAPAAPADLPAQRDFTLLAAGDIGECSSDGPFLTGRLLDQLGGKILAVGDLAYQRGSDADFRNCFDRAWGRYKSRLYPVPGNHEYATRGAPAYFRYFGASAAPEGGYYSFDLPGWHVVALNSNIDTARGSPQERWLRADLDGTAGRCILAFLHHSYFSSGWHGRTETLTPLIEDLHRAGTSIVLTGHDHHYERFAPMDPAGGRDEAHGMRFFVVGTGGAHPYPTVFRAAGSEVAESGIWGVLGLTLRQGGYDWAFIPAERSAFTDVGSAPCATPAGKS